MPRPTARGASLLGVAAAAYLAARAFGTWELYLLSFAFLVLVAVSWLLVATASRRLRATRELIPAHPVADDDLMLRVRLMNASLLPGLQTTFRHAGAGLDSAGGRVDFESLRPRSERAACVKLRPARRGVHRLPAMTAEAEDALGLVRRRRLLGRSMDVTVYPRLVHLQTCVLAADGGALAHRGRPALAAPGVSEFRGIRPHYPGEPLSRVDWKSTAKTGVLMQREMNDPGGGDVTVLLDGWRSCVEGTPPHANYELAVQAAGASADFALRAGWTVDLLLHGSRPQRVRLLPGPEGDHQLLETLARAVPDAETPLCRALPGLRLDRAPGRRTSLWVVALCLDPGLAQVLATVQAAGVSVGVVFVAPQPRSAGTSTIPPNTQGMSTLLSLADRGVACLMLHSEEDLLMSLSARRRDGAYEVRR